MSFRLVVGLVVSVVVSGSGSLPLVRSWVVSGGPYVGEAAVHVPVRVEEPPYTCLILTLQVSWEKVVFLAVKPVPDGLQDPSNGGN